MSKDFYLFQKEKLSFKEKFYILIDLLLSNQSPSRGESIIFIGISQIQIFSGFFAQQIKIFEKDNSDINKILYYIYRIVRFKELLIDKYTNFQLCIIIIFILLLLFTFYFIIICSKIKKNSFYSYNEFIINFFIKCFMYIFYNIILDLVFSSFCLGKDVYNPYFQNVSCKINDELPIIIIAFFLFLITIFLTIFIQFFYCDSFYLSSSFYSRISCNYEIYINLNSIFYSFILMQVKYLSIEVFLIYNIITSGFLFNFFIKHYLFYDSITNDLTSLFHLLYFWTSLFCFIFKYLNFNDKGMIFLVSIILMSFLHFNLKYKLVEKILLHTPFYQITNQNYLLFYIKCLLDKINNTDYNSTDKALLSGIIYMHSLECPNHNCISKCGNKKLYLPLTNEWSDGSKKIIEDKVYLINFIIFVMNYLISQNYYSPDLVINLSLYYIDNIGNYCLAIYYYKKIKEMTLTFQQKSSFERLKLKISKSLIEKFKSPNELCTSVEDIDVTMYFKYEDLSQNFIDEISNDINFSLQFWKTYRNSYLNYNKQIDFNKIFYLTDKIRITKENIEKLWNKLLSIYNGVNDLFDLYTEYIEQINDDDLKKRDLENLRRRNENLLENISKNYYSLLFNKETGIIIANGDHGKEGIIEKANKEVENIFKFRVEELKGMNVSSLMPKNFSKLHDSFIERYYNIGEKIIIDKSNLYTFGKDKDNTIIKINIILKLFPMLNENVYFIGIFSKENIDDIIYIDNKFNIQGMSMKLMKQLNINNNLLFQNNDIPFYVICKKFVNFYKIFLKGKKQNICKEKERKPSLFFDSY